VEEVEEVEEVAPSEVEAEQQQVEVERERPPAVAEPSPEPASNYAKMTVKTLKSILKERGLPLSGKKQALIARLVQFDQQQSN